MIFKINCNCFSTTSWSVVNRVIHIVAENFEQVLRTATKLDIDHTDITKIEFIGKVDAITKEALAFWTDAIGGNND